MPHRTYSSAFATDSKKRRAYHQRISILYAVLSVLLLIVIARLMELQLLKGSEYETQARAQHYGGIALPAKRGEILSRNSKTHETNLLATNTTLDLLYIDPFVTRERNTVATVLAETLLTENLDILCRTGDSDCPRELREWYSVAFDPLETGTTTATGTIIPPHSEIVRTYARDIEKRISEDFVSFVPLVYGATKLQLKKVEELGIPGIFVSRSQKLIYTNPQQIPDFERTRIARILAPIISMDTSSISDRLRKRRLRYVPIMRKIPPDISKKIKTLKKESARKASEERIQYLNDDNDEAADAVTDPLRGIALIPEHWRFYPDSTTASHVVGFVREPPPGLSLTVKQQPQSGIERVFDHELRGQHGEISTVIDPFGGQIFSDEQTIKQAEDGRSVILTIDRLLQTRVEEILSEAVKKYEADSGQVIILDPKTGHIIVMANAPLFDGNNYSGVFTKVPYDIPGKEEPSIVVEIYHPQTNEFIIRGYLFDLSPEGRTRLSRERQQKLRDVEKLYDLTSVTRYYYYLGENNRIELFPSCPNDISPALANPPVFKDGSLEEYEGTGCKWLQYENRIGVGAYVNRAVQEIYEPGSVFKPITMSIAIDQGEVTPDDLYTDTGSVEIDEFEIRNAKNRVFGEVTLTECLSFSVNTCMTHVSRKLGKKLFENYIRRFGLGKITSIQLEDEQPGKVLDWRRWSDALLATAAYGQGISATPIQVVTAFNVLANGGKLVRPTIIDSWIDADGTEHPVHTQVLEQVITEEASETITAMLTHGMNNGFAKSAKVDGYRMAGKTGTSQIAGPGGKYEQMGSGSSITSFAGYAPSDNPKFTMLVKLDRPRTEDYGSTTAAPIFKEISKILFDYYGIPPNEEDE